MPPGMQTGDAGGSMITSQSPPVRLVKLIRDYAFVITVIGLVLIVAPQWMICVVVAFTAINGLFLLASIAFTARAAQRAWAEKVR